MAVYTHLSHDQIDDLLRLYDLGDFKNAEGILQGVDNTNYKITTSTNNVILTLFEQRIDPADIPYFLAVMSHMADNGINCPHPIADRSGQIIHTVGGRPAALFPFLRGRGLTGGDITPEICGSLGTVLGRMHVAGQTLKAKRPNSMGPDAWRQRLERVSGEQAAPFLSELHDIVRQWPRNLPSGAIHADLFPDNVFIWNDQIDGVIDFYFAATDYLAYDLAIVVNAWCFDDQNRFVTSRWDALLRAYESERPLHHDEQQSFQTLGRGAAMRFLSSRLHDLVFHDPKNLVTPKNPDEYARKLDFHRDHALF